jgi:SSS family solute:Na+ symporter
MVTFSSLDYFVIIFFLIAIVAIGMFTSRGAHVSAESFLLNNRKVGLPLFVLTNVATWYGGILGIGEFVYNFGLLSWFTQGLPYYLFAIVFAFVLVPRIREKNNLTIPEQIKKIYGKKASLITATLILLLVSPVAYVLMIANIISFIFNIDLFVSLIFSTVISSLYLFWGGFKSDLYTDAFEFFVMFIGFGIIVLVSYNDFGGISFLKSNLPQQHLSFTGNASVTYIIVWFLIALWTFTDPGFYQRVNSTKNYKVAKYGILISVLFWFLFDFLTTSTGLYSRAVLQKIENPVMSFPMLAEKILQPGFKGVFFAALLATILSTLNSNFFISATTFGKDIFSQLTNKSDDTSVIFYTRIGLIVVSVISVVLAFWFKSVIEIWYTIGSLCIPSLIFPVLSSSIEKLQVSERVIILELILGFTSSFIWAVFKNLNLFHSDLFVIEPMLIGLSINFIIHLLALLKINFRNFYFFR